MRSLAAEGGDLSEPAAYDCALRALAQNVLLLTYRSVRKRGSAVELHPSRSSIRKLIDGRWKMVFHQGTRVDP